jgi:hypothetical protein
VTLLQVLQDAGNFYLVMEYCNGVLACAHQHTTAACRTEAGSCLQCVCVQQPRPQQRSRCKHLACASPCVCPRLLCGQSQHAPAGGEIFDQIIRSGHMTERVAAAKAEQLVSFLAHAHSKHVIHRWAVGW